MDGFMSAPYFYTKPSCPAFWGVTPRPGRAVLAVDHSILITAYHIIKEHGVYKKLEADFFDRLNKQQLINHLTSRNNALGYKGDIEKLPMAG
jgi:hypothetical protein